LASRRSCHGEGNWYLQEGDHHYRFSVTSHAAGWRTYRPASYNGPDRHRRPAARPGADRPKRGAFVLFRSQRRLVDDEEGGRPTTPSSALTTSKGRTRKRRSSSSPCEDGLGRTSSRGRAAIVARKPSSRSAPRGRDGQARPGLEQALGPADRGGFSAPPVRIQRVPERP
jgi:hypothetical protein